MSTLPTQDPLPIAHPDSSTFPYATWGMGTAIIATVIALVAGIFLGIPILIIDNPADSANPSLWATISLQFLTGVGFLLVSFFVSMNYGGSFRAIAGRLGFHRFKLGNAIKWVLIGVGVYIVFSIAYSLLIGQPKQKDFTSDFGPVWVQVLLIVMLAPLSEEVCFRGLLFGGIRNRFPLWIAAPLAGLVFGLLHATTGWSAVPVLVFFGIVLATVYEKTGSIWPVILIHLLNNAIALTSINS